ncbi:MAG: Guanylate kinase [candidate division BRC1 bacterium ADurb.BinA364]|nr:MAG: Guanylate kinase [candidate division BRC1 bacterium ADurb.BinA364]
MDSSEKGRLVILCGPSCAGKSPLDKALGRLYPELRARLRSVTLYNSRSPRPGERDGVDYHFRRRESIEALRADPRHIVLDVRGDLQALDLDSLDSLLRGGDAFFEGNPFVGQALRTHPRLAGERRLSIFMAPLSREEIVFLKNQGVSLEEFLTDVMRRKLLRRTRRQKGELSLKDLENIERRAASAWIELRDAPAFDHVIPNHDGEDSENWDAFYYPVGDARKALLAFVDLLLGRPTPFAEHWEESLFQ